MVRALGRRPRRATAPRRPPDGAGPHPHEDRRPNWAKRHRDSDRILPKTAKATAKLNERTLLDRCCESPRRGVSKTRLTTRRPAQPAIFSAIGSKSLPKQDFSSAAFRLRPTNPWRLGDPSVYLPSWKSEDSQRSSGKRRRKRRAGAAHRIRGARSSGVDFPIFVGRNPLKSLDSQK
jgi:hypothetical protein